MRRIVRVIVRRVHCRALGHKEESKKEYYEVYAQMIHEGLVWLGFTVLVLLMVVLLPVAALFTRALIPLTAAAITVLFVATCVSSRMRDWLYS